MADHDGSQGENLRLISEKSSNGKASVPIPKTGAAGMFSNLRKAKRWARHEVRSQNLKGMFQTCSYCVKIGVS